MSIAGGTLLILSLETATRAGSVAVLRGDDLLSSREGDETVSHSKFLLEYVGASLGEAGVTLREIELFAVATGPGSFTGVRVGLATAKSFCATLGRECAGIQTLHAVARGGGESACTVALLPAGRGEVFAQKFLVSASCDVVPLGPPKHIQPEKLLDEMAGMRDLKWVGEGARSYAGLIEARSLVEGIEFCTYAAGNVERVFKGGWTIVTGAEPLAVSVAKLARARAMAGDTSKPQDLHAVYVRPPDAKLSE